MVEYSIGALSRLTGCNIETIRYYERIGLLPSPPRSAGRHRLYDAEHAKRLSFIRRSRALGFPLSQVRNLLDYVNSGEEPCEEVRELAVVQLNSVRQKLADLTRLKAALQDLIKRCEGGEATGCPILEALYDAPAADS